MKIQLASSLLLFAAIICFAEAVHAPKNSDPDALTTAALGIVLLLRGFAVARQSAVVILSGCALAAIAVAGIHGFVNINRPLWLVVTAVAFAAYIFGPRIEKLWK